VVGTDRLWSRNNVNVLPLLEFCSRDTTTVRMTYPLAEGHEELIITSAYLPYDSDEPPPSKEVRDIVEHCQSRKNQPIIGCDANSHHIFWGITDVNPRGECLMKYLVSLKRNILNQGNETTFLVRNRQEIIDLTLGTNRIGDLVTGIYLMIHPYQITDTFAFIYIQY
jgi:hypothetical protein